MRAQVDHHVTIVLEADDQTFNTKSDRSDGAIMRVRHITGFARDQGKVSRVTLRGEWYRPNGRLSYNQTEKRGVTVYELPAYIQLKITELGL